MKELKTTANSRFESDVLRLKLFEYIRVQFFVSSGVLIIPPERKAANR